MSSVLSDPLSEVNEQTPGSQLATFKIRADYTRTEMNARYTKLTKLYCGLLAVSDWRLLGDKRLNTPVSLHAWE